jgi:hypothetical protein
VGRQELLPLGRQAFRLVAAPGKRGEEQVAPPLLVGGVADGGAEAGVVGGGAGQPDDGGPVAALEIKLVLVVPGEDRVEDAGGGGVAGAHRKQHRVGKAADVHVLDLDPCVGALEGEDVLADREEGFLGGAPRQFAKLQLVPFAQRLVEGERPGPLGANHPGAAGDELVDELAQVLVGDGCRHMCLLKTHHRDTETRRKSLRKLFGLLPVSPPGFLCASVLPWWILGYPT